VLNIYIAVEDFSDMLIIEKLPADLKDAKELVSEFVAPIVFVDLKSSSPKASLYEA